MEHLIHVLAHNKNSFMGAGLSAVLGFIGTAILSNTALVMAIISGAVTALYTLWKWRQDYIKANKIKRK